MGTLRILGSGLTAMILAASLPADPLSKSRSVDFFRDVSSRHLQGTAARSDGRLLSGPSVTALPADLGHDLLWCLAADGDKLLAGTGPNGRILSLNPQAPGGVKTTVELALSESNIFALARLPDGSILAGTSPQGSLVLARQGKVVARAALPVDSIFDLQIFTSSDKDAGYALVATGNPGRIYRVDLEKFSRSGDHAEKLTTPDTLAEHGISLWGTVRDDNIRRLLRLPDGRVIAGSAPKGNIYAFAAEGGAPTVLAENQNAEISDLLAWDGGFFAAATFGNDAQQTRVQRASAAPPSAPKENAPPAEPDASTLVFVQPPPTTAAQFRGRGQLLWFPDNGFPETVATRNNTAFYRLMRQDDTVLITGGEEGELLGYDPLNRRNLTFAGTTASQLNSIVSAAHIPGAFYAMGNNPGSLELIAFSGATSQSAKTDRLDLGVPAEIGALRFNRPLNFPASDLKVELRASFGSDDLEGWSDWQPATSDGQGWRVPQLRGRYVQARLSTERIPFELSSAEIHFLPRNRRPQLQDFHVLSPNFTLIPPVDHPEDPVTTLGQLMQPNPVSDLKGSSNLLSSQVVPQTGTQIVVWNINDPDGDNIVSTFSIRQTDTTEWTDLVVDTTNSYMQFEISHLPEGLYHTRLVSRESAPRPIADRLTTTFETDDFMIDRTPPTIDDALVKRLAGSVRIRVTAHDRLSLLAGLEINFNNGVKVNVQQPEDGILDGNSETFAVELPISRLSGSTSAEVVVYDAVGNSSARRLNLPASPAN